MLDSYPQPQKSTQPSLNPHLIHTIALIHVMMSRAARALALNPLTETTRATGDRYSMESSKISAPLDAFIRLARELRQYLAELHRTQARIANASQPKPMGLADIMKPIIQQAEGVMEEALQYKKEHPLY